MRKRPFLVLGSLVLALGGIVLCPSPAKWPREAPGATRRGEQASSPAKRPTTPAITELDPLGKRPALAVAEAHGKDCPHCANRTPHPPMAGHSQAVLPAVFASMREGSGKRAEFALPDGKQAVGVIERSEVDAGGEWVMSEGRLSAPAEGRFMLRRQAEGTPSGKYAGVVSFPKESYGYTFEEGAGGEPHLTLRGVDDVSCVEYPMPQALIPEMQGIPTEELLPMEHPNDVPIPEYQNGVIPLESLPGAVGVVYLDFDGQEGPHEGWGDFDAAPSGANNTQIREVWARVAEDFAPFNINVTTDLQIYLDAPETSRQRCIITPTTNAAPGAGGVAYIGSWNWGGDTPCWAFYSTGKAAAEVISHEVGHTLGLGHDGQTPDVGYYGGHGSGDTGWAPIMGVGYYQNLSQWSKGEYTNANEHQVDLLVIDSFNSVALRTDDHGDSTGTASALELFGTTVDDDGVISTRTDVDVFSFKTTGGTLNLTIKPVTQGPNLDISAELRNASNAVIASSNPDGGVDASFNLNLAAGTYTIIVDGVGRGSVTGDGYNDYGSLGHYAIDGSIAGAIAPDRFAIDEFPPPATVVGTVTPDNNHGANPLTYSILSGNPGGAFAIGGSTGTLTVANPAQFNHDALSAGWNDPAEFELLVQVTDATQPALNEVLRVVVTVNDTETSAPVILKHRYSFATNGNDSVGTANLTLLGTAGVTGGSLNLPGSIGARTNYAATQGAALTEVAATINSSVAITMEGWFNQDAAQIWAKLFMAGMLNGADYMDITPRRGADGNVSSHSIRNNNDTESHSTAGTPLVNDTNYYFAAIWDGASNKMTLHLGPVGGTLSTYTAPMGGRSLSDITIGQFHLGAAVFYGDSDFDGQLDEFRIWSGALSNSKVAADFAAGPDPAGDSDLDGLPDTWELSFAGVTNLTILNGNLSAGSGPGAGSGDFDGDGLSDAEEYHGGSGGTDPTKVDTDNDGFSDLLERMEGTDPNNGTNLPQPALKHRYAFTSGTMDAIGTANLSLAGSAAVTGGSLELPGSATPRVNNAQALGAARDEIAQTINSAYAITVESWFNQDTPQNFAKIFMAGKGSDFHYMDLTPRRGADGNVSSLSINTGPGEVKLIGGAPAPLVNNTDYYCAAIWNTLTNQLTLRIGPVGGTLSTYTATMGGRKLADLVISEVRFGSAVQWNDPDFDGQVNEIRIWRGALSNSQTAASFAAGPVQPAGDIDGDGLGDPWELSFTGIDQLSDLSATGDFDNDGLLDPAEFTAGTNPADADSDNDGFSDGLEVSLGSNPNNVNDKPTIPPAKLAHRYAFSGNPADAVGTANLTLVGTATVGGNELNLPGGAPRTNHAAAQGAALTEIANTIQTGAALSIEAWFNQDTAQNWAKLFMAGRGSGGEYLDITPRRGTAGNPASMSFNNGTAESTAIGNAALGVDVDYYCAAVWDPVSDQMTLRIGPVGGALSTFTTSLNGRVVSAVDLNEFYLGAAVQFADQDLDGQIKEFRIWKGALTTGEVAASFAAGPDAPPGDSDGDGLPDAWEFSFTGIDHLGDLNGSGDFDSDGLTNAEEYATSHTDPTKADTDDDGFHDKLEMTAGSNPNNADSVPSGPAKLAHRYSFNGNTSDSVGSAHLTLAGTATVTGGKLNLPGSATPRTNHAKAQGAALTELAATIGGSSSITIEGWFNQDTAQNWAKLFMAGQLSGSKYLDLTPRRGIDGNIASIAINNGPAESNVIGGPAGTPLVNDTEYYFAATWSSLADTMILRLGPVGGSLQTYTESMDGKTLAALNIAQLYLGSAVQFNDPDFDGQLDEFRIWKGILTNTEVADHFALGPDRATTLPTVAAGSLNAAKTSFTLTLSDMIFGKVYHVQAGSTLQDFAPVAGSQFTANSSSGQVSIPVTYATPKRRFFRIVEGPLP